MNIITLLERVSSLIERSIGLASTSSQLATATNAIGVAAIVRAALVDEVADMLALVGSSHLTAAERAFREAKKSTNPVNEINQGLALARGGYQLLFDAGTRVNFIVSTLTMSHYSQSR